MSAALQTPVRKGVVRAVSIGAGPILFGILTAVPPPQGLPGTSWWLIALLAWMVVWWLSEALPLAVTALLPVVVMPLSGIAPLREVTGSYGHPLIFLFLGGFMLARAIEAAGLHRRIALGIVSRIGAGPRNLTLGFVIATAFLSMWITNTAATIMMFAVALSVIEVVRSRSSAQDAKHVRRFSVGLMLAVAYSASIGGMATLIGSPVNGLLATTLFAEYGIEIEFVDWLLMGLPVMLIMLVAAWALLTLVLFRSEIGGVEDVDAVIRRERDGLGPMSGPERVVTGVFVLAAVGWILGDPLSRAVGLPISDTTVAIAAAVLLFAIPTDRTFKNFPLDWERARTLPWNVLLLIGGGLAIATGFQSTGLAAVIGGAVSGLDVSVVVLVALMTVMMVFLTEVMSNPASAATILPVAAALAVGVGVSPLLLAVPAALAANMSFMMPVATAPNAIVFSHKELTTKDMAKAGFFLNIIGAVVCVAVTTLTYRPLYGW